MASPSSSPPASHGQDIPLAQIHSNENVRTHFDPEKLKELAASVKDEGILQPLMVRPHPSKKNHFQLVVGERRWRAARMAKLTAVPCVVRELTDDQVDEIQLIENDQREDLRPLERAAGYQKLLDHGNTLDQLASKVKKSTRFVHRTLKLLSLPANGREALERGEIPVTTAQMIASIPNQELREKAAREIIRDNFTGAPLSKRLAQAHIELRYMRELKGAPFDTKSKTLTKAGSCEACPLRTGNNRNDFPDGRGDVCTNPPCYEEKVAAAARTVTPVSLSEAHPSKGKSTPAAHAHVETDAMRARFSEAKRRRASELARRLMYLQTEFTEQEFNDILQVAIEDTQRLAQSSRRADRDLLRHALGEWEAMEIEEIMDETKLTRWVAETNLKDMESKGEVRSRPKEDPKKSGGRPRLIYSLIHSHN